MNRREFAKVVAAGTAGAALAARPDETLAKSSTVIPVLKVLKNNKIQLGGQRGSVDLAAEHEPIANPFRMELKRLAPQAGFEPATLRLTGIVSDVISMVLQCLSSDGIIVIFGVRRVIVQ